MSVCTFLASDCPFEATEENIEDNANPVQVWNGAEAEIYDAEGNPLFEINWSEYK